MVDLHLHTTASDGRCTPAELVARAHAAGITALSVTDHDTVAGLPEARAAAARAGIAFIPGIEITAVEDGRDVHVLAYYIDAEAPALARFLTAQRADRVRRVREMVERLASLGMTVNLDAAAVDRGARSTGRPAIARAMVDAGFVPDARAAFDSWLAAGRPAFVARRGASARQVIGLIREAGGIASLAHPGPSNQDARIPDLAEAGLAALEARHSDHDAATSARYEKLAAELGLAISGGSDFHGEGSHRAVMLGRIGLTAAELGRLAERVPASRLPTA